VPVDLVERIEVYRGVVPIRFGADALGGAVNLVSEQEGTAGSLGYQVGSFHTHRLAAHLRAASADTGLFADGAAYYDTSKNDYAIEVEVPDDVGRLSVDTVERFHDAYRAGGGALVLGVQDRAWTDRVSLRGFASTFYDEIQHNVVMTVPYGEPTYEVDTVGSTARYQHTPGDLSIDVAASYATANRTFVDLSDCVYDWYGECVADRSVPGEISTPGSDQDVWDENALARATLAWQSSPHHRWTLSTAPTAFSRTGEDHLLDADDRDALTAQRDSLTVVSGAEHTLGLGPIENQAFVKHYFQQIRSEEPATGAEGFRRADRTSKRFGFGDGVRWSVADWIWLKASYEWATRLPTPDEVFGDAALVLDNVDLVPETSHNGNVSVSIEAADTPQGDVVLDVAGFVRDARDLIVLLGSDRVFTYFNVYSARSLGVSGAFGWTSPGDWVSLDLNGTWIELRNTSTEGTFEDFEGDRIPNRPWLYANAGVEIGKSELFAAGDRLALSGWSRWVGEFYRGWESVGLVAFKQSVPAQLSHAVALTYTADSRAHSGSVSLEVDNATDAQLYDFFGVEKPGRAFYLKLTLARKPTGLVR
jgi:vitamin B12 transporter